MKYPTFLGIDLTSTEARPSACVGLDSKSRLVYLGFLAKNSDIIALADFYSPQIVAIDAPLSLPLGLCCLEEDCCCRPRLSTKNRQCNRELRRKGIPCYPTTEKTFIKDLIYRGIDLKASMSCEAKQVGQVIEAYPFASKVRLFGASMPRKTTKQGMRSHRDKLGDILPGLRPYLDMVDHNLCDAAVAAYTGSLYHQDNVETLGIDEEGLIFIPI